jgi:hypothetical protein
LENELTKNIPAFYKELLKTWINLHIESPYNSEGTGPILGVKNPLASLCSLYFLIVRI